MIFLRYYKVKKLLPLPPSSSPERSFSDLSTICLLLSPFSLVKYLCLCPLSAPVSVYICKTFFLVYSICLPLSPRPVPAVQSCYRVAESALLPGGGTYTVWQDLRQRFQRQYLALSSFSVYTYIAPASTSFYVFIVDTSTDGRLHRWTFLQLSPLQLAIYTAGYLYS